MQKKVLFLEWVRGLAAVMVAIAHLLAGTIPAFEHFTRNYLDLGRVGVVAFFLVSGYVISMSLRSDEVRAFLIKRMFRLYPIYIVSFTLFLMLKFWDADWSNPRWLFEVFANYAMLQELIGFAALLGPAWTLSIEWVFYAQQCLAKRFGHLDRAWLLGYGWLALFVASNVAERVLGRDLPGSLFMLLAVTAVGHALYLAQRGIVSKSAFWTLAGTTTALVPAVSFIGLDKGGQWPPHLYATSFLAGFAFFAAAFMLRHRQGWKVLPWLGKISYSMYILPPVVTTVVVWLVSGDPLLTIALCAVLIPLVGWLGFNYIERPFNRMGRAVVGRRAQREDSTPHTPATIS